MRMYLCGMKTKKLLLLVCIASLGLSVGVSACWLRQSPRGVALPAAVPQHDTVTVLVRDTVTLPPATVVKTVVKAVPVDVDTAAILAAYYRETIYHDTIIEDRYVHAEITDTVSEGALLGRTVTYTVRAPRHRASVSAGVVVSPGMAAPVVEGTYGRWSVVAGYDVMNRGALLGATYTIGTWQW